MNLNKFFIFVFVSALITLSSVEKVKSEGEKRVLIAGDFYNLGSKDFNKEGNSIDTGVKDGPRTNSDGIESDTILDRGKAELGKISDRSEARSGTILERGKAGRKITNRVSGHNERRNINPPIEKTRKKGSEVLGTSKGHKDSNKDRIKKTKKRKQFNRRKKKDKSERVNGSENTVDQRDSKNRKLVILY